jgi:hypothetical protein
MRKPFLKDLFKSYEEARQYLRNSPTFYMNGLFGNGIDLDDHTKIVSAHDIGNIRVYFHDREVILYCDNGWIRVSPTSYTNAAKRRLNWFTPNGIDIVSRSHVWYVIDSRFEKDPGFGNRFSLEFSAPIVIPIDVPILYS